MRTGPSTPPQSAGRFLPASGQGAAKLQLIRETLQAGFSTAGDAVAAFEQAWPAIERVVGAVVGLFNRAGVFEKRV